MSIRRKLQLVAAASISITVIVSIILLRASQQVDAAIEQNKAAQKVVRSVFSLNLALNDFLLRNCEDEELAWQREHVSLGDLLAKLSAANDKAILEKLNEKHKNAYVLFSQLTAGNKEQRHNADAIISFLDLEEKVVGQLSSESRSMVSQAAKLAEISHTKMTEAQHRAALLVIVFTAVVTVVLATTLVMVSRTIVKPITRLKEAAGVIAGGNLEHKVDVTSNDEIGQLSSEFNQMTDKLKDTYVALQDSFNEMSRKLRAIRKELKEEKAKRE